MSLIELSNVSVKIGTHSVLQSVSLCISANERLAIMGPSGAGKSTLIRVIAGLQAVHTGRVTWHGQAVAANRAFHRDVAMLTQDYALYPQLTVAANLYASLQSQALSEEQSQKRCQRVIDWFELESVLNRLPSEISGGQAQRVAFAKALARQPKLLLLDEPLSQLDSSLRRQLLDVVLRACEEDGIAVAYVTHDLREAFQVASRIMVIDGGRTSQDASPQEIYQSPKSKLVADVCSYWPVNYLPLTEGKEFANLRSHSPPKATLAGIRAEQIVVIDESLAGDLRRFENCPNWPNWPKWTMNVTGCEYLGFANLIRGVVGGSQIQVVTDSQSITAGSTVQIAINPNQILWF